LKCKVNEDGEKGKGENDDDGNFQSATSSSFMSATSLLDQQQGLSKFIASAAGSIGLQVPPTSPGGASVGSTTSGTLASKTYSGALGGVNMMGAGVGGVGAGGGSLLSGHDPAVQLLSQMQLAQGIGQLSNANTANILSSMSPALLANAGQHLPVGLQATQHHTELTTSILNLMQKQHQAQDRRMGSATSHNSLNQIQQQIARQLSQDNFYSQQSLRSVASALAGRVPSPAFNGLPSPMHSRASSFINLASLQQQLQAQQRQANELQAASNLGAEVLNRLNGSQTPVNKLSLAQHDFQGRPVDVIVPLAGPEVEEHEVDKTSNGEETNSKGHKRSRSATGSLELFAHLNDQSQAQSTSPNRLEGALRRRISGSRISSAAALTSVLHSDTEVDHSDQEDYGNSTDAGSISVGQDDENDEDGEVHEPKNRKSSKNGKRDHRKKHNTTKARPPTPLKTSRVSETPDVHENLEVDHSNSKGVHLEMQKAKAALVYYQAQNNAILKRAMIHAKFDVLEIDDTSPVFHAFFAYALEEENKRLRVLKKNAKERPTIDFHGMIPPTHQAIDFFALAQRLNQSSGQNGKLS